MPALVELHLDPYHHFISSKDLGKLITALPGLTCLELGDSCTYELTDLAVLSALQQLQRVDLFASDTVVSDRTKLPALTPLPVAAVDMYIGPECLDETTCLLRWVDEGGARQLETLWLTLLWDEEEVTREGFTSAAEKLLQQLLPKLFRLRQLRDLELIVQSEGGDDFRGINIISNLVPQLQQLTQLTSLGLDHIGNIMLRDLPSKVNHLQITGATPTSWHISNTASFASFSSSSSTLHQQQQQLPPAAAASSASSSSRPQIHNLRLLPVSAETLLCLGALTSLEELRLGFTLDTDPSQLFDTSDPPLLTLA